MRKFSFAVCAILVSLFANTLRAEDKPANIPASPAVENQILKAEHAHDQIVKKQTDVNVQLQNLSIQAQKIQDGLQKQAQELGPQEKSTAAAVDAAIEQAWKESGLDKSKYDFDPADFVFKPKAAPAPTAKK
jgi:hypothetical protein